MKKEVSIIVPMRDEGINVYNTIKSVHENTEGIDYEVIVVDDGSTGRNYSDLVDLNVKYFKIDKGGAAKARNFGVKHAAGDTLVFLDAHMKLSRKWLNKLIAGTRDVEWSFVVPTIYDAHNPGNKGYGLTFKSWALNYRWEGKKSNKLYEVPLGTCACVAVPRKVFDMVGGFDQGIKGFGLDEEIFLRAWLLGFKVIINPDVEVGHLFKPRFTYKVDSSLIIRNTLRLAFSHFNREAISKVMAAWRSHPNFFKAYLMNSLSDIWIRRWTLFKSRMFDDDWFFRKFNIKL